VFREVSCQKARESAAPETPDDKEDDDDRKKDESD
jgi:hypothetical protein